MAPPSSFINYPKPQEHKGKKYEALRDNNPILSGVPLLLGAHLIKSSALLQRFFWRNIGLPVIKDMPELDDIFPTFHPCVIPTGDTSALLDFEKHLTVNKYAQSDAKYYSVSDYHDMYKSGKVTPLQVAKALLPLIRNGQNPPTKYGDAWIDTRGKEDVVIAAATESTRRYAAGKPLSIVDGVPIGVKDDTAMKGYVSHFGMAYKPIPFFKEQEETAWPVKALQNAGAVVVGKNCMHEIGSETSGLNLAQGTPTNHLNNSYYPGGSSSGGSSAVSAGIIPFCVATDAGGSTRIPPNFNGIYGMKTTHARTMTMSLTMAVTSPIAANVSDLTIAYRLMSQPNPDCNTQGRFAASRPPQPGAKRYLGIYREWFEDADEEVVAVCRKAVDWLVREKGYELVDIDIPHIPEGRLAHNMIAVSEMVETARRRTPNPADYLSLVGLNNKLLLSVATQTPTADYLKANGLRELLMQHLAFLFQKYPGMLILTPTVAFAGWPKSPGDDAYGSSDVNRTGRSTLHIFLANLTGTPAVSAPVGYVDPAQGEGRLPISLMATGEWGSEEEILAWAADTEEYLYENGRRRPDSWLDVMKVAAEEPRD